MVELPEILLHHSQLPAGVESAVEARWLAALPAERADAIARRNAEADRASALAGPAVLGSCARGRGLGTPPWSRLVFPSGGKPSWPDGPDFSISNAAGRIGCALAPPGISVGLDLERRGTATLENLRLVTGEEEQLLYEDAGLTPTDLWVAKEAVIKAAGASAALAGQVALQVDSAVFEGRRYALVRPFIADDIVAAVASSHPASVQVAAVDAAELLAAGP